MNTAKTNGIELAKYVIEVCKCNKGFDLAGLKDLAKKTIKSAKIENESDNTIHLAAKDSGLT